VLSLIANWLSLFRQDRLLADKAQFYRQLGIGAGVTAVSFLVVIAIAHNSVLAAVIAGLAGGALQPLLFRNLRYR
jgi:hypothetical protein